jgi:hypothetical protein
MLDWAFENAAFMNIFLALLIAEFDKGCLSGIPGVINIVGLYKACLATSFTSLFFSPNLAI